MTRRVKRLQSRAMRLRAEQARQRQGEDLYGEGKAGTALNSCPEIAQESGGEVDPRGVYEGNGTAKRSNGSSGDARKGPARNRKAVARDCKLGRRNETQR